MAVGISVVLLALGAVLVWGTNADPGGGAVTIAGVVLMAAGGAAVVVALSYRSARGRASRWRGGADA